MTRRAAGACADRMQGGAIGLPSQTIANTSISTMNSGRDSRAT